MHGKMKQLWWSVCALVSSEHKGKRHSRKNLFKYEKISRHFANAYRGLKDSLSKTGRTGLENRLWRGVIGNYINGV